VRATASCGSERHRKLRERLHAETACADIAREQLELERDKASCRHHGAPVPRRGEDRIDTVTQEIEQSPPPGRDVVPLVLRQARDAELACRPGALVVDVPAPVLVGSDVVAVARAQFAGEQDVGRIRNHGKVDRDPVRARRLEQLVQPIVPQPPSSSRMKIVMGRVRPSSTTRSGSSQ
jgi:hypothetical protein